jgi:His-Xaa-Ser system protein HxsD
VTGCACGAMATVFDRAHMAVRIDLAVFSMPAVLRSAYKLSDRCYVLLTRDGDGVIAFLLGKTADADVSTCLGELGNELVDQQLREHLEQRFMPVRTLLTAQAFAEGNLLDPES